MFRLILISIVASISLANQDLDGNATQAESCKPGTSFRKDCNTCFCLPRGHLECTKMRCLNEKEKELIKTRKEQLGVKYPEKKMKKNIPSYNKVPSSCKPGSTFHVECNSCHCTAAGVPMCTKMLCLDAEQRRQFEAWRNAKRKTGVSSV